MKVSAASLAIFAAIASSGADAFSVSAPVTNRFATVVSSTAQTALFSSAGPTDEDIESALEKSKLSDEEVEQVGNLVTDDEWMGLGMELT